MSLVPNNNKTRRSLSDAYTKCKAKERQLRLQAKKPKSLFASTSGAEVDFTALEQRQAFAYRINLKTSISDAFGKSRVTIEGLLDTGDEGVTKDAYAQIMDIVLRALPVGSPNVANAYLELAKTNYDLALEAYAFLDALGHDNVVQGLSWILSKEAGDLCEAAIKIMRGVTIDKNHGNEDYSNQDLAIEYQDLANKANNLEKDIQKAISNLEDLVERCSLLLSNPQGSKNQLAKRSSGLWGAYKELKEVNEASLVKYTPILKTLLASKSKFGALAKTFEAKAAEFKSLTEVFQGNS